MYRLIPFKKVSEYPKDLLKQVLAEGYGRVVQDQYNQDWIVLDLVGYDNCKTLESFKNKWEFEENLHCSSF